MKVLVPVLLTALYAVSADVAIAAKNKDLAEAKRAVLSSLKDPESARFGAFTVIRTSACLTVNAKNSMGGYTGKQEAVLSKIGGKWQLLDIYELSHAQCVQALKKPNKADPVEPEYDPAFYDDEPETADTIDDIKTLAHQGDAAYQYRLGLIYLKGKEINQNKKEGLKWLKQAGNQGHLKAQQLLARCYLKGNFTAPDTKEGVIWLRKAAENGDMSALKQLAEHGDADAQNLVGVEYTKEYDGAYYGDKTDAVKWFRKSAVQGNKHGQFNLAQMYDRGEGVGENKTEARKWYEKAASQGESNAMLSLAVYFRDGIGVPADKEKALSWARKAAENGNAAAESFAETSAEKASRSKIEDSLPE